MSPVPLRIAHFNSNPQWGGGEQQILDLIRGCEQRGVKSTLIARADGELFDRCSKETDCERIGFRPRKNPFSLMQLCGILKRCNPDVLHIHDGKAIALGVPAASMLKQPVVLHRRISSRIRRNILSQRVYRARCIAAYIAVSRSARQTLIDNRIAGAQIQVIPSGVNVERLQQPADRAALRRELGLDDGVWIGTVCALNHKKDVETLLRAAAILRERQPDWRYVVVGDGPERTALTELAQQLGVAGSVRFVGHVAHAWRFTSVLDAFAFPSLREGSPGVVKEAMALGVPVIAANSPGTDEVVTDSTGVLVRPQDPAALAEALRVHVHAKDAAAAMAERARRHVTGNYSMARTVDATVELYERVTRSSVIPIPSPRSVAQAHRKSVENSA